MKKNKFSGFTMIELLVVIFSISLLSFMAISAYGASRSKSRDSVRLIDIKQIGIALEAYYDDHNFSYPDCSNTYTCDNMTTWETCLAEALKPYMAVLPKDPLKNPAKSTYCYNNNNSPVGRRVYLSFKLENRNPNVEWTSFSVSDGKFNYYWEIKGYND